LQTTRQLKLTAPEAFAKITRSANHAVVPPPLLLIPCNNGGGAKWQQLWKKN